MDREQLHHQFVAAAAKAGGLSAYSRIVGVSKQSVAQSIARARPMPVEHVLKVEAALGINRSLLRPDIYPAEPAAS